VAGCDRAALIAIPFQLGTYSGVEISGLCNMQSRSHHPGALTLAVRRTPRARMAPGRVVRRGSPSSLRGRYRASRVTPASSGYFAHEAGAGDYAQGLRDVGSVGAGKGVVQEVGLGLRQGQVLCGVKSFGFQQSACANEATGLTPSRCYGAGRSS